MRAMVLEAAGSALVERAMPEAPLQQGQIRLRVEACGVCRSDLHLLDGELPQSTLPIVPGHEIVGVVVERGPAVDTFTLGQRVGVPWLGRTCGRCRHCLDGQENLCDAPEFTGCTRHGGFATHAIADAAWCFALPEDSRPEALAPLLCAGLIGWRALQAAGPALRLGIYGLGAAGSLIAQVALRQGRDVVVFTHPGDAQRQAFARALGITKALDSTQVLDDTLDAAILFAPVGELVPLALQNVRKGGTVVCGGIHMSQIPAMPYSLLWGERRLVSVANLTRRDAREFLSVAHNMQLRPQTSLYRLQDANRALKDLRHGRFDGAAVLVP